MVGIGSALVMVTFEVMGILLANNGTLTKGMQIDPGRLAAGIITGIGFLGAGTIIRVGDWVRGLTTAASLWVVAALGIVAGEGLIVLAIGGTAIGLAVLTLLDRLEQWIPSIQYFTLTLKVVPERRDEIQKTVCQRLLERGIRAQLTSWESAGPDTPYVMSFSLRHRQPDGLSVIVDHLAGIEGIVSVHLEL
jgi:putative Mg2+ transporter-C (MgtC) family protein